MLFFIGAVGKAHREWGKLKTAQTTSWPLHTLASADMGKLLPDAFPKNLFESLYMRLDQPDLAHSHF